ncbi:MAG TPA: ABC transporter permease [Burkholderiales bacterium]|nr:ABC transporter permease [Burkholderiales bacterium]
MTLARISFAYLRKRRSSTLLNVVLLAFAVGAVTLLLLTGSQLEERIRRDAHGIDLVVGAKGSETQLILAAVYALDEPGGSMSWSEAQEIAAHRGVRRAIPLAFGDHYFGFRIVGTSHDYVALHGARLARGRLWGKPLEAVVGADVALRLRPEIGSTFEPVHAVTGASGIAHPEHDYRIVGVLERTGSVLDGLILTGLESYWTLHPAKPRPDEYGLIAEPPADPRTVNALLLQYDVSHVAREVPYVVAAYPHLQAASPAEHSARMHGILAISTDLIRIFAVVLIASAVLSMFIALYGSLSERRYDLAVMRTLGATRERIMGLLLFEGFVLAFAGALLGLALGHALTSVLGLALHQAEQVSVTGMRWHPGEPLIVLATLLLGTITALLPAWRAHEVDIAATLARG